MCTLPIGFSFYVALSIQNTPTCVYLFPIADEKLINHLSKKETENFIQANLRVITRVTSFRKL